MSLDEATPSTLPAFQFSDTPRATKSRSTDYAPGEGFFGTLGPQMVRRGWSVFPQERSERRRSAMVDGRALKWKEFQDRLPTADEVDWWALQNPTQNVAVIMGKASGNAFAIDVDISDPELSELVQICAFKHLGKTPFRRVGRAPRIVLIYRHAHDEKIPSRSWRFADPDDAKSDDGLEILAHGKPATFYGLHHKTGQRFVWQELHPVAFGPELAPLVDMDQIEAFTAEVNAIRPFHKNVSSTGAETEWEYDREGTVNRPRLSAVGHSNWTEDEEGYVVDGREQYLFNLALRYATANPGHCSDEEGMRQLKAMVLEEFKSKARLDGRWTEGYARQEVNEKVNRFAEGIRSGQIKPANTLGQKKSKPPARVAVEGLDSLSFLPTESRRPLTVAFTDKDEQAASRAKLSPDRTEIATAVQDNIVHALDTFFGEVYGDDPERGKRIHVLKAPTGAGKTSRSIQYIAEDPRTRKYDEAVEQGLEHPGPVLFMLPTYNNIDELRLRAEMLNLDGSLTDEELAEQAVEQGLIPEDQLEARLADLRRNAKNAGLRTMIYKGKVAAGCKMTDKMKVLQSAGIGTAGLCRAQVTTSDGEKEDKFCQFYSSCPAIQQRKEIARSHVVFLPHAFFTLTVPEELNQVRAVVADERIFHLFVHTTSMMLSTLARPRKQPRLTKKEREAGADPADLLADRELAAKIAREALVGKQSCPALRLFHYRHHAGAREVRGLELVKSAIRVCGNAISSSSSINPDMSMEELEEIALTPTGTEVREEYRFWKIIEERIEALDRDRIRMDLARAAVANYGPESAAIDMRPEAKGSRDMRLQLITEQQDSTRTEFVRLSWRSKPNWAGAPLLLLDASASPDIISKIFDERSVVVHEAPAPLNVRTVAFVDRTYANAAIVPTTSETAERKAYAATLKDDLRRLISMVSGLYGWGRVVVGSSVIVRRAVNTAWQTPQNTDYCHFGAMRGLDFAKNHTAAISVGRMEVPIRIIDGLVAALTFDDDEPEDPYDLNGDGIGPDGMPLMVPSGNQVVEMRDGRQVTIPVPTYPGRWAKIVQQQYREEELRQFVGRLRPVYREGEAPIWFAVSKVIPDGIVVDEVLGLTELVKETKRQRIWDIARLTEGVIHPRLGVTMLPAFFQDESDVAEILKRYGFNTKTGACGIEHRYTWGFTPVRVSLPGPDGNGETSYAFVQTELKDPEQAVRTAFSNLCGIELAPGDVEAGQPVRARAAGVSRDFDWVDGEIGSMEERKRDEAAMFNQAGIAALTMLPAKAFKAAQSGLLPTPVTLPIGTGNDRDRAVPITSHMSLHSTELMWEKLRRSRGDMSLAPVFEAPGAAFERLGDHSADADEP